MAGEYKMNYDNTMRYYAYKYRGRTWQVINYSLIQDGYYGYDMDGVLEIQETIRKAGIIRVNEGIRRYDEELYVEEENEKDN
jgi:hypothetical protein